MSHKRPTDYRNLPPVDEPVPHPRIEIKSVYSIFRYAG